jgi:pyruvate dehydrogenase E2 component (dihydrolipoamide acetyltransferase)
MADVRMPRLTDGMEEGTLVRWLVAPGAEVAIGDDLAEVETDKATVVMTAESAGTFEPLVAEGDDVPVGTPVARLDGAAEAVAVAVGANAAAEGAARAAVTARAGNVNGGPSSGRTKASPIARRAARELGIDLHTLAGTGPGGRIVKADVLAGADGPDAPPAAPAPHVPITDERGVITITEPSRGQKVIARRMVAAKREAPEFTLSTSVDMEAAVALRAELKEVVGPDRPAPSYNDIVVKACANALREFPRANGAYVDERFEGYERVNVGIAVAAEGSLVVPTIFDADRKGLGEIAVEARRLAGRVRSGEVSPAELAGGTFTVSNLGMYGIGAFTAVLNPPQAAILAVGAMQERPIVRDGSIVVGRVMDITITCDHRILYGAEAAEFLARIKALLERPVALAL